MTEKTYNETGDLKKFAKWCSQTLSNRRRGRNPGGRTATIETRVIEIGHNELGEHIMEFQMNLENAHTDGIPCDTATYRTVCYEDEPTENSTQEYLKNATTYSLNQITEYSAKNHLNRIQGNTKYISPKKGKITISNRFNWE